MTTSRSVVDCFARLQRERESLRETKLINGQIVVTPEQMQAISAEYTAAYGGYIDSPPDAEVELPFRIISPGEVCDLGDHWEAANVGGRVYITRLAFCDTGDEW